MSGAAMELHEPEGAPDLADFMNDWFFGTIGARHSGGSYDLTGDKSKKPAAEEKKQLRRGGGGSSASKQTQEWLEEARKMVAAGSPNIGSPARQMPRFAGCLGSEPSPVLDRRDPMSRSARRHRQAGGIGDEILQHASISSPPHSDSTSSISSNPQPPRRRSRFQDAPAPDPASHRHTVSSSFSSSPAAAPRLPHHRRHSSAAVAAATDGYDDGIARLNSFLRRQRAVVAELAAGDSTARAATVVLSDASNSVSSIVAAICYAWFLANKGDGAVPVVNMRRRRMVKCMQAVWLLYHVGVDASALLFADEVDMEGLIMARRVSLLVVGQDVLKTDSEVGSVCTVLTDNYCEKAYSILESLDIKKLLLAGILLDTNNLSKLCSNRDSEAVQLLLVGTSDHKRHELFQQLMLDHNNHAFVDYLKDTYRKSWSDDDGNSPPDQKHPIMVLASGSSEEVKRSSSNNRRSAHSPATGNGGKASDAASRGKNKIFLAKWFGFGSK